MKTLSDYCQLYLDGLITGKELHTATLRNLDLQDAIDNVDRLERELEAAESKLALAKSR